MVALLTQQTFHTFSENPYQFRSATAMTKEVVNFIDIIVCTTWWPQTWITQTTELDGWIYYYH